MQSSAISPSPIVTPSTLLCTLFWRQASSKRHIQRGTPGAQISAHASFLWNLSVSNAGLVDSGVFEYGGNESRKQQRMQGLRARS